jgi:hypothetical protein
MANYRKIWESVYGGIPDGYEIHHKDGNRSNNNIENLQCVSTEDHYKIHYKQGDYMACSIIALRMNLTYEEKMEIHKKAMKKRDQSGEKNPMYGRSAIKENNLKWYNDGANDSMFAEGEEPFGWTSGRIYTGWTYDKSGASNPRARKCIVNGIEYGSLKNAADDIGIPHSSLKSIARGHISKKHKHIKVSYL